MRHAAVYLRTFKVSQRRLYATSVESVRMSNPKPVGFQTTCRTMSMFVYVRNAHKVTKRPLRGLILVSAGACRLGGGEGNRKG